MEHPSKKGMRVDGEVSDFEKGQSVFASWEPGGPCSVCGDPIERNQATVGGAVGGKPVLAHAGCEKGLRTIMDELHSLTPAQQEQQKTGEPGWRRHHGSAGAG